MKKLDKHIQNTKNKFQNIDEGLSEKEKQKLWIKTLLYSSRVFPEITKTLDKIIELQASTISFMSDIYSRSKSTYDQAEKIIDLTQRKKSILDVYLMVQSIVKELSADEQEFVAKKFVDRYTVEELAAEYGISERTVYRKSEAIIESLCKCCARNNISLKFILSQISNEGWLFEKYYRLAYDYKKIQSEKTIER